MIDDRVAWFEQAGNGFGGVESGAAANADDHIDGLSTQVAHGFVDETRGRFAAHTQVIPGEVVRRQRLEQSLAG